MPEDRKVCGVYVAVFFPLVAIDKCLTLRDLYSRIFPPRGTTSRRFIVESKVRSFVWFVHQVRREYHSFWTGRGFHALVLSSHSVHLFDSIREKKMNWWYDN